MDDETSPGAGADIVMESIALTDTEKGEAKAQACENACFRQLWRLR
jgi:hypothetical protein